MYAADFSKGTASLYLCFYIFGCLFRIQFAPGQGHMDEYLVCLFGWIQMGLVRKPAPLQQPSSGLISSVPTANILSSNEGRNFLASAHTPSGNRRMLYQGCTRLDQMSIQPTVLSPPVVKSGCLEQAVRVKQAYNAFLSSKTLWFRDVL